MVRKLKNIKKSYIKRVQIDPLYNSLWYSKFQNNLMLSGKKALLEKIFSQLFLRIKKEYKRSPVWLLFKLLIKNRPVMGLIKKRIRNKFIEIPCPIETRRQVIISLKWLIGYIKIYPAFNLEERLWGVFIESFRKKKTALTRRVQLHQEKLFKNRSNLRYRWQ
jgi:ribosomal protein S7